MLSIRQGSESGLAQDKLSNHFTSPIRVELTKIGLDTEPEKNSVPSADIFLYLRVYKL